MNSPLAPPAQDLAGLPRLLTPDDVAELLQVSVRWVLNAARDGDLPCVRVGRFPRFRPDDVRAFIEQT
jgi:excisionase family DNA binding protein